ncbi:DUF4279 domain-containing protein [Acetivibrio sp. MSJd-27]|uniref:DUF4279 domain-containing protein n=1 Tax=Acetivibrio sp. MSJd-27 TaxID=2841523 RepID=UPI001C0FAAD6|nr:DUF4279 domain-containing protein [Acetivibrio sp. MSJd-27]MBU5451518.1 DUF4279 domain-containing protein [Acetivibrio sp. MSJd-27]
MGKTTIMVSFTISSIKLDHKYISEKLGISPNYIRKSDEVLNNQSLFGHDEWSISTKDEESLDIKNQLCKILSLLDDKIQIINKLCEQFKAECSILITIKIEEGQFPAMEINQSFIKFLSSINANIGFDMYFYSDCT